MLLRTAGCIASRYKMQNSPVIVICALVALVLFVTGVVIGTQDEKRAYPFLVSSCIIYASIVGVELLFGQ
jgi:cytochrome b subunit of formate dehydrogenase